MLPFHNQWPLARVAVPQESTDLVIEVPLAFCGYDMESARRSETPGLWLMLRNLALPAQIRPKPGKGAAPAGPVARIVIDRITCTVQAQQPGHAARQQALFGAGTPEDLRRCAERVWGRSVAAAELAPYLDLRQRETARVGALGGQRQSLAALLIAPDALYLPDRRQDPGQAAIDQARRLALLFWGEAPDARLRELAGSRSLGEAAALRGEIARLLADPRSSWFAHEFTRQWLGLDELADCDPTYADHLDMAAHPRSQALRRSLGQEPGRFLHDALQRNRPLSHLLTPDRLILDGPLATFYGAAAPIPQGWQPVVALPDGRQGGILTMAGPIAVASRNEKESPIYRGVYLLGRILGVELGTPPPNVPTIESRNVDGKFKKLTARQKLAAHNEPTCAVCHDRIDPLGFAWAAYDQRGAQLPAGKGKPADTSGTLPDGRSFSDVTGMARVLLERPDARTSFPRAFVAAMTSYLLGRRLTLADDARIDRLLGAGDPRLAGLFTAILIDDLIP